MSLVHAYNAASYESLQALARTRPLTPDQLHLWVRLMLDLDVPREPVCTDLGHCAPFDYLEAAFFDRFTDAVIWANRGGGKTMLGAIVTLLDGLFKPGVAVRILGGSLEQSQKMNRYLRRMLLLPYFRDRIAGFERLADPGGGASGRGRGPEPGRGRLASLAGRRGIGARSIYFANGSEVEILAQSERSVRGNRVQKMRCDEIELFDTDVWTSCQLVTESREQGAEDRGSGVGEQESGEDGGWPQTPSLGFQTPAPDPRPPTPGLIRGAVEAFSTMHRPHGLMHRVVEQARRAGSPVYRWCVLDVLERCPADRDCRGCPLGDDCRGRAKRARGFYRIDDAIAARARVSRETWEAEMLCLRPSRRGAVFPAFARDRHVAEARYQSGQPLFRAIDFGFVNPFVCLWLQVMGNGDVHVLREYVRSRATLASHVQMIRDMDPGPVKLTFCDPAGGQSDQITGTTARAELQAAGIVTRARPSAITDGLEIIRRYLEAGPGSDCGFRILDCGLKGQAAKPGASVAAPSRASVSVAGPTLRIDPVCERLIAAMEAYRYPDSGEARFGRSNPELPIKDGVHDHPIDALRYFFVNHIARRPGRLVERLY